MATIQSYDPIVTGDLQSEIVMSLELQRGEGVDLASVIDTSRRWLDSVAPAFAIDVAAALADAEGLDSTTACLRDAQESWRAIDTAFRETRRMALQSLVPLHNLQLDTLHEELRREVGEPLAMVYAEVRRRWKAHLAENPWDAYRAPRGLELDNNALDDALTALTRGDELDIEDAVDCVASDQRAEFLALLESGDDLTDVEPSLWRRPDIIIGSDYWRRHPGARLLPTLANAASPRFARVFGQLEELFNPNESAGRTAPAIIARLGSHQTPTRNRFMQALLLHPDYDVRRYAVANVSRDVMWTVLSSPQVPCATVLTILERLTGSNLYTTSEHKIFFDTVYERLLTLPTKSDVQYARGVIRMLVRLNFFLEDHYFDKLCTLLEYVEAKEKGLGIVDPAMANYRQQLRERKQTIGTHQVPLPSLDGIPLVVLRRLARTGQFWPVLISHPIVKIARETVPHINTRDRAATVARNHTANPEVLRDVGKRRSLFVGMRAKLDLLSNPRTPLGISLSFLEDLGAAETEALLRRQTIHPELRNYLRKRLSSVPK